MGVRLYQAIQPDGSVLWEDERPLEWLEKKRKSMPPALFNAQYQNDPSGMKGVKFDVDWLHFYDDVTIPPIHTLTGVQGGDPATSERRNADYFGHCTAGKDPNTGIIYILDFAFANISAPKHLEFLHAQYQKWRSRGLNISRVILETNGPQQATTQHLIENTRNDPRGSMPIETVTPKGSKAQRYDAIIPFIANGSIVFKGERRGDSMNMSSELGFREFQQEYSSFPRGGRDDILDALWIATHNLTSSVEAASVSSLDLLLDETPEELYHEEESSRDRVLSLSGRNSLFHRGLRI